MRIGGLGGAIVSRLGANAMSLPAGEISTSLETGRLDATELSFPLVDRLMGFNKAADNYYFPGRHQPAVFIAFYVNKGLWDGFTDAQRTAIEVSCNDINLWTLGVAAGAQAEVLTEFREGGTNIQRFPDSVLDALRAAADDLYAEKAAEDEIFARVIDSYRTYAAAYQEYQDLSVLD